MMKLFNTDTILGAVLTILGATLLVSSYTQSASVFVLPGDAPPFLVPQAFLYLWIGIAIALFIGGLTKGGVDLAPQNWLAILAALIVIVSATALMTSLGYLIVAPVSVFLICLILGFRNFLLNGLVAVTVTILLYILLTVFAKMPLPTIPGLGF